MPNSITKCMRFTSWFISLLLLVACDGGAGWSKKKPTFAELEQMFARHADRMKESVRLCSEYPEIRWVGPPDQEADYYQGVTLSADVAKAVAMLQQALVEIPAYSIHCGRRGDYEDRPLAVVTFVVYASGISVSGSSVVIIYSTPWSNEHNPWTEEERRDKGYKALGQPGWYTVENN